MVVSPNTSLFNKTIVYSDTVLSLKDLGSNLKVCCISNVSEYSLEDCLKTIFESNPDVIFNTIQYSRRDKKVYFYTNQDITTKVYEDSKFQNYKPITSRAEILEEVKRILLSQINKDDNCISLYDVLILLRKLNNEYDNIVEKYENKLNYIVKEKIYEDSLVYFHGLDYEKKFLNISFEKYSTSDFNHIYFTKKDGDLYVVKSESCWTDEVFSVLSTCLSEMYDKLLKFADYKDYKYTKFDMKPVNSSFSIKISNHGVWLFVKDLSNSYKNQLELFAPSYKKGYNLKCNSSIINESFSGKESEIFKRIFVKISDCPEWSQSMLYEIRKKQLDGERKIEDELKHKEIKKQKRLELKRRFFSWINK